jgi:hypothetical protein
VKRVLLALIPVAFLATASLALSGMTQPFMPTASPLEEEATPIPPRSLSDAAPARTVVAQAPTQSSDTDTEQVAQAEDPLAEEPLPEFVVDRTQLNQASADLLRAIEQAKLAVTALDADAQQRYIQETLNFLVGANDSAFRLVAQSRAADEYKGIRPLLVEARVVREAAEVEWIAAVQRQLEARVKKLTELAQAGAPADTASQPAQPSTANEIAAVVGPTGVLGTRGVRPEEQAHELVSRAVAQAMQALRFASATPTPSVADGGAPVQHASDDAAQAMDSVVRILQSVQKIIQIAVDR